MFTIHVSNPTLERQSLIHNHRRRVPQTISYGVVPVNLTLTLTSGAALMMMLLTIYTGILTRTHIHSQTPTRGVGHVTMLTRCSHMPARGACDACCSRACTSSHSTASPGTRRLHYNHRLGTSPVRTHRCVSLFSITKKGSNSISGVFSGLN